LPVRPEKFENELKENSKHTAAGFGSLHLNDLTKYNPTKWCQFIPIQYITHMNWGKEKGKRKKYIRNGNRK
jgi:hypothetical protein